MHRRVEKITKLSELVTVEVSEFNELSQQRPTMSAMHSSHTRKAPLRRIYLLLVDDGINWILFAKMLNRQSQRDDSVAMCTKNYTLYQRMRTAIRLSAMNLCDKTTARNNLYKFIYILQQTPPLRMGWRRNGKTSDHSSVHVCDQFHKIEMSEIRCV